MTTDATVRAWCREQGIEVPARGKLGAQYVDQYAEAHPDADDPNDAGDVEADDAGEERAPSLVDDDTGETPPRINRPNRARGLFQRVAAAGKPGGPKRRISLETVCTTGWSILASAAAQAGRGPTARVLAMQAPVAGTILETSLKGTVADKVLQPLARATSTGSKVGALLGPPILVSLLDRHPEWAPQALPLLRLALREWVMTAGPAMKAEKRRQQRAMEELGLDDETSLDQMIEGMVQAIFADPDDDPDLAQAEYAAA